MASAIVASKSTVFTATRARVADFTVLRALPVRHLESIGPFVFLDHFGPAPIAPGSDGVGAHPHAGIEVMTYLLEGQNEHSDSIGNVNAVAPGGMQVMTAGRGLLHAEKPLSTTSHGIQLWSKLKPEMEQMAPAYRGYQPDEFPVVDKKNCKLKVLAGRMLDVDGPVELQQPSTLAHASIDAGATLTIGDVPSGELGVYMFGGSSLVVEQDGVDVSLQRAQIVHLGASATVRSLTLRNNGADVVDALLVGGEVCARPLIFGGPFVFHSSEALRGARYAYQSGAMGTLHGVPF